MRKNVLGVESLEKREFFSVSPLGGAENTFTDGFESGRSPVGYSIELVNASIASVVSPRDVASGLPMKHEVREHVTFLSANKVDQIFASPDVYLTPQLS